jgi:dUTPase
MRIAQVLPQRVTAVVWEEVSELATSARGDGGFGHTGV